MDGIVIPTGRCSEKVTSAKGKELGLWYSGKAHTHGGKVQGLTGPDGVPLFVSQVGPGSVRDLPAARGHVLGALHAAASKGLSTLADAEYQGAGIGITTPVRQPVEGPPLAVGDHTSNRLQCGVRCLGERAMAVLTGRWRVLRHTTLSPSKTGMIVQAAPTPTNIEKQTR
ncbi:hypothetical protein HNR06_001635 [Nocardiopsis arvandica]|uniref:DDE Tnp4 domain-containing protein n=1 Tax=Nocardiopsis sinuspersici TaxID=501010 RepID=A0A7Y9XA50_9ACTN|nr:transposase family protein [Nocardiopsis sinuspersici]NYH52046.1 hypothetical protein [Nocardiopsis sinuspersici]